MTTTKIQRRPLECPKLKPTTMLEGGPAQLKACEALVKLTKFDVKKNTRSWVA